MVDDNTDPAQVPSADSRQALVDALQNKTVQFLQGRLEPLFTRIDERLFDIANSATSQREQTHFFDTMRMLRLHRDDLGAGILAAVAEAFRSIGRSIPVGGAAEERQDDELSLELVKNDVLEEMITLDNMVSRVIARAEPELDLLTRRLSFLVGHSLPEDANPFVPDYLCEGFARKTASLKLDFEPRLVLLTLFDRILFKDWPVLVRESNHLLREANILADLEKRRPAIKKAAAAPTPPAHNPSEAGAAPSASTVNTAQAAGQYPPNDTPGRNNTDSESRADTAGPGAARDGLDRGSRQPVSPSPLGDKRFADPEHIYADVLAGLRRQIHQQARAERESTDEVPDQQRAASFSLGVDELAGILSAWRVGVENHRLLETLASEGLERAIAGVLASNNHSLDSLNDSDQSIVRLLDKTFGRLNAQALNPPILNQLVLKLELPATWLALKDPMFLERPNHPGRRLMNELCKATSTLAGEEAGTADPLQRKIDEILERLNSFAASMSELTGLLTEFIDFVEKDMRHQSVREQRVLEEEEAQSRLTDANGQVVRILTDRLVNRRWPRLVVTFCEKAWARVLFMACLRHGYHSAEWRDALGLLDRLLVLVSARRNPEESELVGLLGSIEENLHHVGYDRGECQHYLDSFRLFFASLTDDSSAVGNDHAHLDNLDVTLPGEKAEQDAAPEDLDVAMLDAVDTLKKGTWVEFRDEANNTSLRCKLAGMVNSSSKLVFTNRKGVKVAQEYRHRMAVKMQQGRVIVLDNSHLFDQAYDQAIAEIHADLKERSASG